jgi:hypothetical protein
LGSVISIVFGTGWVKLGLLFHDRIPVILNGGGKEVTEIVVLVVVLVDWDMRISRMQ